MTIDYRLDFPILQQLINGQPLVYLDSAATAQKPQVVIDTVKNYYQRDNANVHRAVHTLCERATAGYELAREKVRGFINAQHKHEIIFTKGTTDAINLVANSFGRQFLQRGDVILLSTMEHHSNIVPWQLIAQQIGVEIQVIPVMDDGQLDLQAYADMLSERVKLVSVIHVSNALGTINPVQEMIELAHARDIPVLLDGAQAVPHMPVDMQALNCDFYAFSAHKMYGPTGVGVLYGKERWLEAMPPYQGGGDMIRTVSFEQTDYNVLPYKFEAGTPNIAGVIGLGAAIDYLNEIGMEKVMAHEQALTVAALDALHSIAGLRIIGAAPLRTGVISFVMDAAHAHDVGTILNDAGVAIRVGHHCAMPLMQRFGVAATARISLGLYNSLSDVERAMTALEKVNTLFVGAS